MEVHMEMKKEMKEIPILTTEGESIQEVIDRKNKMTKNKVDRMKRGRETLVNMFEQAKELQDSVEEGYYGEEEEDGEEKELFPLPPLCRFHPSQVIFPPAAPPES